MTPPPAGDPPADRPPADRPTADAPAMAARVDIRHLSLEQLAGLGVSQIAYVRPVMMNGARAFAIHAADGTPMAVAEDETVALAAIRQHEMVAALLQ